MAKLIVGNSTVTPIKVIKEEVPVVAPYSAKYTVDSEGKLQPVYDATSSVWPQFDLGDATDLGNGVFKNVKDTLSDDYLSQIETIDLHKLTKITGNSALCDAFYNKECSSLNKIDLSNVVEISGDKTCYDAFEKFRTVSTGQEIIIDLSSLQTIYGSNDTCAYMFENNYDIYNVSLPELKTISDGNYSARNMFSHCGNLETVSLESLETITGSNAAYNMLGGAITPTGTNPSTNSVLREIYLPSLKYIDGAGYMFSNNPNLTDIVFGSSDLVLNNTNNIFRKCYGISSIDFMDSVSEIQYRGAYYMFDECTGITGDVHLRNIRNITGDRACEYMFTKCSNITSITFDSLISANVDRAFYNINNAYNSLTDLYFPKLVQINNNTFIDTLISAMSNVTLHFASNLYNNEAFQNIINVVGGTNTVVLFDLPAVPEIIINIPSQYGYAEAYFQGVRYPMIDSEEKIKIPLIDDNMEICFYVDGYKIYNFNYDRNIHGMEFELPEPEITSNLTINSNNASFYEGTVTINNKISFAYGFEDPITYYETSLWLGPDLNVDIELYSNEPEYFIPARTSLLTDGYNTNVSITFPEPETIFELDSSNFETYLNFEEGTKWYIEEAPDGSGDMILRIHQDQNIKWETMQSIPLTIPENVNTIKVSGWANADSENNYDYGFIAIDNGETLRTYQQIKGWSAGGELIMKDCGQNGYNLKYFEVDIDVSQLEQYDPLKLSIGYGQDTMIKGTNSFYVKNIKIIGF